MPFLKNHYDLTRMAPNLQVEVHTIDQARLRKKSSATQWDSAISTVVRKTGKWIAAWEIVSSPTSNVQMFGIAPASFPAQNGNIGAWYAAGGGYAWYGNDGKIYWHLTPFSATYGAAYGNGVTAFMAVDLDARKIWFGRSATPNITWEAGGNPAAGTGEAPCGLLTEYSQGYVISNSYSNSNQGGAFLRITTDELTAWNLPSGFLPWGVQEIPTPRDLRTAQMHYFCMHNRRRVIHATGLQGRLSSSGVYGKNVDWEGTFDAVGGRPTNFSPQLCSSRGVGTHTQWFTFTGGGSTFSGPVTITVS